MLIRTQILTGSARTKEERCPAGKKKQNNVKHDDHDDDAGTGSSPAGWSTQSSTHPRARARANPHDLHGLARRLQVIQHN
jgi:hypothetical protein